MQCVSMCNWGLPYDIFFFFVLSKFLQLTVGSRDLSQAEKNTVVTSWETQKMATFFTKFNSGPFWVKIVNLLSLQLQYFFSAYDKLRDSTVNWRISREEFLPNVDHSK